MGNISETASKYKIIIPFNFAIQNVSQANIALARKSWQHIIGNKTRAYIEMKNHPDFHASSCLAWFYDW